MQVILLERVEKLGQMGDEVKVKDGFARNFLLPKKKALRATNVNREYFQTQKTQLEARNLERKSEAQKVAEKLEGKTFMLLRQAGDRGQLYGSVSPRDISDAISTGGFSIRTQTPFSEDPVMTPGNCSPIRRESATAAMLLRTALSTLLASSSLAVQCRAISSSSGEGRGSASANSP